MKNIYSTLTTLLLFSASYCDAAYSSVGFTQAYGNGSPAEVSISRDLAGKVRNNRYYAPKNLFSVKCFDQNNFGQSVSDEFVDGKVSKVILESPYQKATKIEYWFFGEDLAEIFAVKEKFTGSMEYLFSEALDGLVNDKSFNRKTGIIEQKYISDDQLGSLNWGSIKFSDNVHRGFLHKAVGGDIILVTVDIPPVIVNILNKANNGSTPNNLLLEYALGTLKSMDFKK